MRGQAPEEGEGFGSYEAKMAAEAMDKRTWKRQAKFAKATESDRRVLNEKPKHLFSGKRGMGKTDRR
jgi:nucleolar GTP-binding protein